MRSFTFLALAAAGCAYNPLFPDPRTPSDFARETASHCKGRSEATDAAALSSSLVESVEASYSYVQSGNERLPHLRGAKLHLAPQPSLTAELLQRAVECHEARVVLGSAPALADDPYSLPGAWVDVKAESTGDGFVISVLTDHQENAKQVLDRARRFAAPRP